MKLTWDGSCHMCLNPLTVRICPSNDREYDAACSFRRNNYINIGDNEFHRTIINGKVRKLCIGCKGYQKNIIRKTKIINILKTREMGGKMPKPRPSRSADEIRVWWTEFEKYYGSIGTEEELPDYSFTFDPFVSPPLFVFSV